ncbi:MAG: bifunctional diaminohydroxyphosphoribosylaminopyrimidine deaminase/5-amino-6-(5-phosphoribosylamino)uracil reductase RibD [Gammaproteobacteria bacterium]|nr:bifunctional diaminohydroxyphosphoribosylaminopyrimidine deaminase/5-amino-6-(5-phosphoribosylamino)uracil reductase RibD [Gammaproteobacteria bacterium]
MARALALARRALMATRPNPAVGCVLVKDGSVVGEGWHHKAGEPHAEVIALRAAGTSARGAHCYVTLEPCAHHGRTPPCADALIDAGVARVVAAMHDPNPRVAGAGLARLAAAGIGTACGLLEANAQALNPGFLKRMRTGLPYVRLKVGASLDGRTAMASGESHWITGAAARRDVHRLRALSGAVLTGVATVLADDPQLTARDIDFELVAGQPLRAIADPRLRTPAAARAVTAPGGAVLFACAPEHAATAALAGRGAEIVVLPAVHGRPAPRAMLEWLAGREVNDVLIEAGATLTGAFLAAGVVDEVVVYLAPRLLGDAARGIACLPGLTRLTDTVALEFADLRRIGADLRIIARPVPPGP